MGTEDERPPVTATARHYVFRSSEQRTFKACRTCRQQKARCHGADNPPCRRCKAAGRDCIFDLLGSKRRQRTFNRVDRERTDDYRPATPCDSPGEELHDRSGYAEKGAQASAELTKVRHHAEQQTASSPGNRWPVELESRENENLLQTFPTPENPSIPEDLNLLRLNAPITAVHAMRPKSPSIDLSSPQSHRTQSTLLSTFQNSIEEAISNNFGHNDIITAGLLSESKARELFHLYMAGANVFLPLFDATTDTFESIRERSAFCLCAILTVALQLDRAIPNLDEVLGKCQAEAQSLASQTLFSSSSKVEDIQAMLVLASYAEKNWFAINHALEMAEDMGLRRSLLQLLGKSRSEQQVQRFVASQKELTRMARAFLILHHVEPEVASGIARQSKLKPVENQLLRSFLECKHSVIYDIRIISTIEITQLRARLIHEIESSPTLLRELDDKLSKYEKEIAQWFGYWDKAYQEHEIIVASFHRASLRLQRDYALIILGSAMISQLGRQPLAGGSHSLKEGGMSRIMDVTMRTSINLLIFMSQSESYKWHLRWAPTYSALFAVFAAALVFKLSVLRPLISDRLPFLSALSTIADVLDLRYSKYSQILRDLAQTSLYNSSFSPATESWGEKIAHASDSAQVPSREFVNEPNSSLMSGESLPTYVQHQPLHAEFNGGETQEVHFVHTRPEFMLDYNSFAASLVAFENGCTDSFDYTSLTNLSAQNDQSGLS